MSGKDEYIAKHGEEAYEKTLERARQWNRDNPKRGQENKWNWYLGHPERQRENGRNWKLRNPEKVKETNRKQNESHARKGGKYYLKKQRYNLTGIQGKRNRIRAKHRNQWKNYKNLVAPNSQIHHAWREGSAKYDGVALVDRDKHQHGIIDVIKIIDGEITLLTEKGISIQPPGHKSQSSSLASGSSG